jgi:hypothetical protein
LYTQIECYDERVLKATLAAIVLLLVSGSAVSAQTDSVVAVGVSVALYEPTNPQADHHPGVGVVGRLRRGTGLGFSLGLGWFTSDVQTEFDGQVAPLGTMKIRPLMLGASYAWQFGHFALSAGLVGGWSFNSITQTPEQQRAYGNLVGMPDASVSVGTGWAARPSVTFWRELGNHFAAAASVGYMINRPTVTTSGAAGVRKDTVNLSAAVISFGLLYGVF